MNIHKNFLPQDKFITLQSFIMSDQMPWYYNDGVVSVGDSFFQFTFGFVSKQQVNCSKEQMTLIEPILSKIRYISEFNIGHFIISESIFLGIKNVIRKFKKILG